MPAEISTITTEAGRLRGQHMGRLKPAAHLAQFYEDDGALVGAVARHLRTGLTWGEAAVIVATRTHREALEERLRDDGVDVEGLRAGGIYVALDANETLSKFMVDGAPSEAAFNKVIGEIIRSAAAASRKGYVRVFGEMVAILCEQGKRPDAIRLEELWNQLLRTLPFSLYCGYPLDQFSSYRDGEEFLKICSEHSRVVPAESYSKLASRGEQLRAISYLQHRAKAVETENADRKRAEQALRLRDQELSEFFENAFEGIYQVGPSGKILWANPAQLNMLGYAADEYIGHHVQDFFVDRELFDAFWSRLMQGEPVYDFAASIRCKDGSVKHAMIHSSPHWEDGRFVYGRCFVRDVTERVQLEDELQKTIAQLAENDRRKNEFLAMLGHELRNPLSAVSNAIAIAGLDRAKSDRALQIARRQTDHLARLVDDLLDLGRITQGRIALRKELVRIGNVINSAVDETRSMLEGRAQSLTVFVSAEAEPVAIEADASRLQQVLTNLIHNAIKFSHPGGRIEVLAERRENRLIVRVRDSGIGITPEMLPRVFDLFAQAHNTPDQTNGGLGIGLTLVKRLVELHGGRVRARSNGAGKGAEFEICLPIPELSSPNKERDPGPRIAGRGRILIVEDNADAAEGMKILIELYGYEVVTAADGIAALDAARKSDFNGAFVDIGLPGMNGYELARHLREIPTFKPKMMVALSGYGLEEDRRRALSAGFDQHAVKPLKVPGLESLLARMG